MIPTENKRVEFFSASGTTSELNWFTWVKPSGIKMVEFLIQGGGGGGGRVADGNSGNGGKGGSSGSLIKAYIPAILLPSVLYLNVGLGGKGATTASTTGANGGASFLCTEPITTSFIFNSVGGNGGGSGSSGGAAPTSQSVFSGFASQFIYQILPGLAGSNGATSLNTPGSNFAYLAAASITSGGAGGGNGSGSGGGSSGNGFHVGLSGGTGNAGGAGKKGIANLTFLRDISIDVYSSGTFTTGGTGGGGFTTGTAGRGGDGALGSGGGGGGGCNNAAGTSGNGGDGGDGFIAIIYY